MFNDLNENTEATHRNWANKSRGASHGFLVAPAAVRSERKLTGGHVIQRHTQRPQVNQCAELATHGPPQHRALVHVRVLQHNNTRPMFNVQWQLLMSLHCSCGLLTFSFIPLSAAKIKTNDTCYTNTDYWPTYVYMLLNIRVKDVSHRMRHMH